MPLSTVFWLFFPMAAIVILSIIALFTGKENEIANKERVKRSAN